MAYHGRFLSPGILMDLPVSKETNNIISAEMRLVGVYLRIGGIDISKLTPYGKNGIAIRESYA